MVIRIHGSVLYGVAIAALAASVFHAPTAAVMLAMVAGAALIWMIKVDIPFFGGLELFEDPNNGNPPNDDFPTGTT